MVWFDGGGVAARRNRRVITANNTICSLFTINSLRAAYSNGTMASNDEENVFPIPNLKLQQHLFVLVNGIDQVAPSVQRQKARTNAGLELLKGIEADGE